MTITTNDDRDEYTATASQTVFNYTFKIFASTDLNVYQTPAGQTANDLTDLITAYTVSGVGSSSGGTITLTTPASAGDLITIVSDIPSNRTTDYQVSGDFVPATVNNDFDRMVSLAKQAEGLARRSLLFEESQQGVQAKALPKPDPGKIFSWDESGNVVYRSITDVATPIDINSTIDVYPHMADFITRTPTKDIIYVESYAVWSPGVTTPKGAHYRYKTGGTNTAPTVGSPVAVSTIGTGTQAGYAWTADGVEWFISLDQNINVYMFGAAGDGSTDDSTAFNDAIQYASLILKSIGGGQDADNVRSVVNVPAGEYYITLSINMASNIVLRGEGKTCTLITTDQSITAIEYPDISPSYYTGTLIEHIALENTTGSVGKGINPFRCARNNEIRHVRTIGFQRNIHVEDSFTINISHWHGMGQSSDNNLLITGSIVGEVIVEKSRLDGSNSHNVYWNQTDRGELVIRDTAIQFCQLGAIFSRTCQHVILDNVFMEGCYQSSSVAGYWIDLQGATPRPNAVTTAAVIINCSFAGSTDSGTDPNGLGLVKLNVFDHVTFAPKWMRHYNAVAPTVTAVKNFYQPKQYLNNTFPFENGLTVNNTTDDLSSSAQFGVSSDFAATVTNAGIELRSRNDGGSAWEYTGIYKRGSTGGVYHPVATPGLTGKPAVGHEAGSGVVYDDNSVKHFEGKNDGFTFMPRCYANTTGSAANVFVASSGNMQRSTSSRRWKENERESVLDTSAVLDLVPVLFDYKDQEMPDGSVKPGEKDCTSFIAEDSGIFAALDEEGLPDGINWNLVLVCLVEEVKKLKG